MSADSSSGCKPQTLSRRAFIRAVGHVSGALTLSASWPGHGAVLKGDTVPAANEAALTAWVRITPANEVTLVVSQAEIGQGISTTLPAILADELGADWAAVKLVPAPFAPAYRNPRINFMFTGNSESIQSFHDLMRRTGAAAREMLVSAAARRWQVGPAECTVENSVIFHPKSGRELTFGAVARQAARLKVPQQPKLKSANQLKLAGRSLQRIDIPEKVDGSAVFGIDFVLPGMLNAAVRTAPVLGSASCDPRGMGNGTWAQRRR